jgi:putative spermidine/putrescine transport system ATP-binding protein
MSLGRNEQTATPAVLYARPATPFVAEFVGISSRIRVQRSGDDVVIFGQKCRVRGEERLSLETELDALLRPEDVTIDIDPGGAGFVTHKSFLGATTRLVVQVQHVSLRVDVRSDFAADIELGTRVRPSVIARDVLVAAGDAAPFMELT